MSREKWGGRGGGGGEMEMKRKVSNNKVEGTAKEKYNVARHNKTSSYPTKTFTYLQNQIPQSFLATYLSVSVYNTLTPASMRRINT